MSESKQGFDSSSYDDLLLCLEHVCQLKQKPFSKRVALAGLPLQKQQLLSPSLFIRAAFQVGLQARLRYCPLKRLSQGLLPVVFILEKNEACVLEGLEKDGTYRVFFPKLGKSRLLDYKSLNNIYTHYVLFFKHQNNSCDARVDIFHKKKVISWFFGIFFENKSIYLSLFLASLLSNIFVLLIPIFVLNVYDRTIPNRTLETLWALTLGLLVYFIFDFIIRFFRSYLLDTLGQKADIILASRLFEAMLHLKLSYKPVSTGGFANVFNEFEMLRDFFTSVTLVSITDAPFIILFLIVIAYLGGVIVCVPLITIPLALLIAYFSDKYSSFVLADFLKGSAQKQALLIESISGLETIKALNYEGQMQRKWEDAVTFTAKSTLSTHLLSGVALNVMITLQQLSTVGVVALGAYLVIEQKLSIGGLIACTILTGRALSIGQIAGLLVRFERSRLAAHVLNKMMNLPCEAPRNNHYVYRPKIDGNIEFKDVCFFYPGQKTSVLKDISFTIQKKEKVGLIGPVGVGKTTLLKMIVALYEPTKGSIMIDGTSHTDIHPIDLRQQIAYLPNDNQLFFGSVRENILMGNTLATQAQFDRAVRLAGIDMMVKDHPKGFDMPVGEHGAGLSAGERQAIALARTFVANPSVVLLDEPTSNVDTHFENRFIQALKDYVSDKTLLITTHRVQILNIVDRIIVMGRQCVIADGPREKVLAMLLERKERES